MEMSLREQNSVSVVKITGTSVGQSAELVTLIAEEILECEKVNGEEGLAGGDGAGNLLVVVEGGAGKSHGGGGQEENVMAELVNRATVLTLNVPQAAFLVGGEAADVANNPHDVACRIFRKHVGLNALVLGGGRAPVRLEEDMWCPGINMLFVGTRNSRDCQGGLLVWGGL